MSYDFDSIIQATLVNIVATFQKMRNIFPDFLFFSVKVDKTAYLLPFFYTMTLINSVKIKAI